MKRKSTTKLVLDVFKLSKLTILSTKFDIRNCFCYAVIAVVLNGELQNCLKYFPVQFIEF